MGRRRYKAGFVSASRRQKRGDDTFGSLSLPLGGVDDFDDNVASRAVGTQRCQEEEVGQAS